MTSFNSFLNITRVQNCCSQLISNSDSIPCPSLFQTGATHETFSQIPALSFLNFSATLYAYFSLYYSHCLNLWVFVDFHGRESSTSGFIATSAGRIFPGDPRTSHKYLISYLLMPLSLQGLLVWLFFSIIN